MREEYGEKINLKGKRKSGKDEIQSLAKDKLTEEETCKDERRQRRLVNKQTWWQLEYENWI